MVYVHGPHIVPMRVINWIRYWQRHTPPHHLSSCGVGINWAPVKHPSEPKEDHELITNPVGALADRVDAEARVAMVTETFHCNRISWLLLPRNTVNNTSRSMQSIFHCQPSVNPYHPGNTLLLLFCFVFFKLLLLLQMNSGKESNLCSAHLTLTPSIPTVENWLIWRVTG